MTAADIIASTDLPPFDNSAVDGYAVRHADLKRLGETRLVTMGDACWRDAPRAPIAAGEAIRIFTGAPMPEGADTVFMQEDCRVENSFVVLPPGLKLGANRRIAGEDLKAGAIAVPAGRRLAPQHIALAAALGVNTLNVRRRVRVACSRPATRSSSRARPRPAAALYDANRRFIAALLARYGAEVTDLGILPDEPEGLPAAIAAAAARSDLVLTSGGVSTGEADFVRRAVEKTGKLVFWRVAIKPGRPVAMGVVEGARLRRPAGQSGRGVRDLRAGGAAAAAAACGRLPEPLVATPVRAGFAYSKKKGRREYVRVALSRAADGGIEAQKHPQDGAGVITSLTETDGLAELTEDQTSIEAGATVGFLPYAALMG